MTVLAGPLAQREPSAIAATDIIFLRNLVLERSAIVLDESKHYLISSRLEPLARKESLPSIAELVNALRKAPRGRLEQLVIEAMTTNETSFFRDSHPFAALTESIIPQILSERGPAGGLTIWCGASSSGQEPYSIAIAIGDKFPELLSAGRLRILATDISPTMVARTRAGRFTQLEVNRGLPARQLIRFFQQDGNDWVANREIRQVMDARVMNLIAPWTNMPKCDLVFLRNVLIYFNPETKRSILERIRREVLRPGGQLFLGSSETTLNIDNSWIRNSVGRSISYIAPPTEPAPRTAPAPAFARTPLAGTTSAPVTGVRPPLPRTTSHNHASDRQPHCHPAKGVHYDKYTYYQSFVTPPVHGGDDRSTVRRLQRDPVLRRRIRHRSCSGSDRGCIGDRRGPGRRSAVASLRI